MTGTVDRLRFHYFRAGLEGVSVTVLRHLFHWPLSRYHRRAITDHPSIPRRMTVDPGDIAVSTIPRNRFPHEGPDAFVGELGGVWDRFQTDLEQTVVYRSIVARFEHGTPWEDTELYRLEAWKNEHFPDEKTLADLEARCDSIDRLYADIEANGYRPTNGLIERVDDPNASPRAADAVRVGDFLIPDEPRVGLGRDGTPIRLGGGRHRIAIARLLEVDAIPAIVLVQHPASDDADPGP